MKYEVGTTTELPQIDENKTHGVRRFGGGTSGSGGNGKNGGGGGGGGDRRDNNSEMEEEQFTPSKYRIAMYIILTVVGMSFAGFISAYVFISVNKQQEWQPFDLPIQIFVSTALILASSATFELARLAIKRQNQAAFRRWLVITAGLGGAFISSQLLSWLALARQGIYVASNPYAGFFYILTAAHGLHLLGGIAALGYLILRAWNLTRDQEKVFKRQTAADVVGMYWHSMDVLWLVLFGLLAFWK